MYEVIDAKTNETLAIVKADSIQKAEVRFMTLFSQNWYKIPYKLRAFN